MSDLLTIAAFVRWLCMSGCHRRDAFLVGSIDSEHGPGLREINQIAAVAGSPPATADAPVTYRLAPTA